MNFLFHSDIITHVFAHNVRKQYRIWEPIIPVFCFLFFFVCLIFSRGGGDTISPSPMRVHNVI